MVNDKSKCKARKKEAPGPQLGPWSGVNQLWRVQKRPSHGSRPTQGRDRAQLGAADEWADAQTYIRPHTHTHIHERANK